MIVPPSTPWPPGLAREISPNEIASLPIVRYEGDVHQVATPAELDRAMEDFNLESVVGFDTETRPTFRKGDRHLPCLVQVATARAVYLFRLRELDRFEILSKLLEAHPILKVGIGLADDLRALKGKFPFDESGLLDLGDAAKRSGFNQTGLRNLAGILLGIRIPKGVKTSNWEAQRLSAAQITYAATDAWICRELFLRLHNLGLVTRLSTPSKTVW